MTVTVELPPDVGARAAEQAAAHGMNLDAYLASVLEQSIRPATTVSISTEDFEAGLAALAEGGEKLPVLSEDATSRAGIYRDHD